MSRPARGSGGGGRLRQPLQTQPKPVGQRATRPARVSQAPAAARPAKAPTPPPPPPPPKPQRIETRPMQICRREDPEDGEPYEIIGQDDEELPLIPEHACFITTEAVAMDAGPVLTETQFLASHESVIAQTSDFLDVHRDVAFQLLIAYSWNKESLFEDFSSDCAKAFRKARLPPSFRHTSFLLYESGEPGECPICMDDFAASGLLRLTCGHSFCRSCWTDHLENTIDSGRASLRCPSAQCDCPISIDNVMSMCNPSAIRHYIRTLLEQDIQTGHLKIHCIRPDCPFVLTIESVGLLGVARCRCGTRICWRCNQAAHAPTSCQEKEQWKAVVGDEGLVQTLWERENTRPCPNCKQRIEKDGGCNHMQCSQCRYEFCWICGHEWNTHTGNSYACANATNWVDKFVRAPMPSEKRLVEARKAAMFLARYRAHEESQTNEKRRRETTINDLVNRLMRDNMPGDQAADFALRVFGAIEVARSVLLWSYPCAFYMVDGPGLRIFQHLQGELAQCLDGLTDCVENKPNTPKDQLQGLTIAVEKYTEALLKQIHLTT